MSLNEFQNNDGTPRVGSVWVYRGVSVGQGLAHKVIFSEPHEVVTVGEYHSWLGDKHDFVKEFQPTK
jgi:hypothetical protein